MLDTTLPRFRSAGLLFREACEVHSSEIALICAGQSWTFERLWFDCARVASALARQQIGPSSCVASWSPNAAEALIAQWGAILVGAQTIHLDPDWEAVQAHAVLRTTKIDCLFARAFHLGRQYPAMIKTIRADCSGLGVLVTHGRELRFERVLRGGWLDFLDSGDAAAPCAEVPAATPTITFFKEAELDEHPPGGAGWSAADCDRLNAARRPLCVAVPCWQPIGLSLVLHAHLCGQTIVLVGERSDPLEIKEAARQTSCELVLVSPTTAQAVHAAGLDSDLEEIRWISQTSRLAEDMDTIVRDIGFVVRTVSSNANLG
jgi:acyl-CoA synthetase (AMP-forming)/AMP-acid ligase II